MSYVPPAIIPLKAIATLKSLVTIHSIKATINPTTIFCIGINLLFNLTHYTHSIYAITKYYKGQSKIY